MNTYAWHALLEKEKIEKKQHQITAQLSLIKWVIYIFFRSFVYFFKNEIFCVSVSQTTVPSNPVRWCLECPNGTIKSRLKDLQ